MLQSVYVIARNTFREVIRDRILYGLAVFGVMLVMFALALGQLSFSDHVRLTANFGFTAIHISSAILSIFIGSTLVSREIEKQTILTLLARPISRTQFILGKAMGLMGVILCVDLGLALILALILAGIDFEFSINFGVAMFGVLIEALLLVSLTLFYGTFAKPFMTVVFSAASFLLGHWISSLDFFVEKSQSEGFRIVGGMLMRAVPNLEAFNWRSAPVYNLQVAPGEVLVALFYGLAWSLILLSATSIIFRRRDFV